MQVISPSRQISYYARRWAKSAARMGIVRTRRSAMYLDERSARLARRMVRSVSAISRRLAMEIRSAYGAADDSGGPGGKPMMHGIRVRLGPSPEASDQVGRPAPTKRNPSRPTLSAAPHSDGGAAGWWGGGGGAKSIWPPICDIHFLHCLNILFADVHSFVAGGDPFRMRRSCGEGGRVGT